MADGGEVCNTGSPMSVVVDRGVGNSRCGYCKSPAQSSVSHGLWAFDLTLDDYQGSATIEDAWEMWRRGVGSSRCEDPPKHIMKKSRFN